MVHRSRPLFEDRRDAGRKLARRLATMALPDPVVLGLPRGGVPVAAEVADALGAPLDVLIVRKLGLPPSPEVAMGAVGEGGTRVLDIDLINRAGVTPGQLAHCEARERVTIDRRAGVLRSGRPPLDLHDRTAVIVDDGIATGATASAAAQIARRLGARRVVVAAPVGAPAASHRVRDADAVVCLAEPIWFESVGAYYEDFSQVSDKTVGRLLGLSGEREAS